MVRDAVTESALQLATVNLWVSKAEASDPPNTGQGRLVRLAAPLPREYASRQQKEER